MGQHSSADVESARGKCRAGLRKRPVNIAGSRQRPVKDFDARSQMFSPAVSITVNGVAIACYHQRQLHQGVERTVLPERCGLKGSDRVGDTSSGTPQTTKLPNKSRTTTSPSVPRSCGRMSFGIFIYT